MQLSGRHCVVLAAEDVERDMGFVADDPAIVAGRGAMSTGLILLPRETS
jgi:hypothetical protein